MGAVANYNLQLDTYCDSFVQFTWTAGGAPVNFTGAAARLMIRNQPTDAAPLISISTTPNTSGSIALGGSAGTIGVTVTKLATSTVNPTNTTLLAQYDLLIDWANGTTTKFASGTAYIGPTDTH